MFLLYPSGVDGVQACVNFVKNEKWTPACANTDDAWRACNRFSEDIGAALPKLALQCKR